MSKIAHAIYLSIIVALGFALVYPTVTSDRRSITSPDETRVVVLPYVVYSYFADDVAAAFSPVLLRALEAAPNLSVVPLSEIPVDVRTFDQIDSWPGSAESYVALKLVISGRSESISIDVEILDGLTGEEHGFGASGTYEGLANAVTEHVVALSTRSSLEPS